MCATAEEFVVVEAAAVGSAATARADLLWVAEVSNAPTTVARASSAELTDFLESAAGRTVDFAAVDSAFCVGVGRLGTDLGAVLVARGAFGPAAWPRAEEAAGCVLPESSASAHATAVDEASAAPIPSAIARPPTRPI